MFGFLKSKKRTYPRESRWTVLEGTHAGKPLFARRNESASDLAGHPEYRFRIGVALPLKSPNEHGFPGNDEMFELNAIEDTLVPRLESDQRSLQVLAITTGGMREFIFYTRDPVFAQGVLEALRSEVSSHEVQGYIEEDPKWDVYAQFA